MRVCKRGDEEGVIEIANSFVPEGEQRDVFGDGILFVLPSRSSFIQKDLELLRKHFDVRVRGFSFEHEKIKKAYADKFK